MTIEDAMRYYLTPITMALIKETNNRRDKTEKQLLVKKVHGEKDGTIN